MRIPRTAGPSYAYKSYGLHRPNMRRWWVSATCEQVDCPDWQYGWRVDAAVLTPAHWADIRRVGYKFKLLDIAQGNQQVVFEAGQSCFRASEHQRPTMAEPLYLVRPGVRGAFTGQGRRHTRGIDWVEDFSEHADRIAERIARG